MQCHYLSKVNEDEGDSPQVGTVSGISEVSGDEPRFAELLAVCGLVVEVPGVLRRLDFTPTPHTLFKSYPSTKSC
jgi:hypothetical protein